MGKKLGVLFFFIILILSMQGCMMSQSEYEEAKNLIKQYEEDVEKPIDQYVEEEAKVLVVHKTFEGWHFDYVVLYYSESQGYNEVYISASDLRNSIEFEGTKDALYISKDNDGYIYRLVLTTETYENAPIFYRK